MSAPMPDDENIAAQFIRLGVRPGCTCNYHEIGGTGRINLEYDYHCPVHYPKTATILGGKR